MENIEKILQWNMGSWDGEPNGQVLDVLEALIEKHEPSLVALQEFPENGTARVLESAGYNVRYHTERRRKMSGFSDVWSLDETRISEHYSGILLVLEHLELSIKLNFWNVHFQAKAPERKRRSEIRNFATNYVKTSRQDPWYEVVVGDFNFEPFEESLADIDGFGANRCYTWVRRSNAKTPPGARLLLNRAWSLMAVENQQPGSFYKSDIPGGPWLVFDQVLVSCTLQSETLPAPELITSVGNYDLKSQRADKPSEPGSDHFPICTSIYLKI